MRGQRGLWLRFAFSLFFVWFMRSSARAVREVETGGLVCVVVIL